jgi:N-acetylglucosamine-6-sulfatase
VIVYTSDNGFLWGEHRRRGKIQFYEESIRVPLLVRAPGVEEPGRSDPSFALNIDLASTPSEFAGVRPALAQDGRSLVPLLRGRPAGWRTDFLVEFLGDLPPPFEAVRTDGYVYAEYRNGWRELYDLSRDPNQLENVAGAPEFAAIRREMAGRLDALRN